jgi:hypothetical protein
MGGILHKSVIGLAALGSGNESRSDEGGWEGEISGAQKNAFVSTKHFDFTVAVYPTLFYDVYQVCSSCYLRQR